MILLLGAAGTCMARTKQTARKHSSSNYELAKVEKLATLKKKLAKSLIQAVRNKYVTKVKSLLACGACPNHQLYWSKEWGTRLPPLHRACCDGHLEIVKMLVTHLSGHGACTCFTDDGGGEANRAPLHWACSGGHIEVVQYLIKEVNCSTGKQSLLFVPLTMFLLSLKSIRVLLKR